MQEPQKSLVQAFLDGGWLVPLIGAAGMIARILSSKESITAQLLCKRIPAAAISSGIAWYILEQTNFGRRLYAIGGNREASYLAGIKVVKLRMLAFALTGLGAAIAGLMYASRVASANPTQGAGLMLDAIAAVFLGMTMSKQSEPRVIFTLIGVLVLGVLDNGMTQMRVDSYVREILVGLIVIAAVAVSSISKANR